MRKPPWIFMCDISRWVVCCQFLLVEWSINGVNVCSLFDDVAEDELHVLDLRGIVVYALALRIYR